MYYYYSNASTCASGNPACALYAGFLLLNAFDPDIMGAQILGGLNLAVVYGLGLIAAAFVLALVYAWLCRERAA